MREKGMEKLQENRPICPVCGMPVNQRFVRSGENGRAKEYRRWHIECNDKYREMLRGQRMRQMEARLDEAMSEWRQAMVNSADDLRIAIEDRNEEAKLHDPEVVRLMYLKCRQAILMMNIEPQVVIQYKDRWIRRLAADIGSDGMDLIADRAKWVGPRGWRDDPEVGREGRLPLVIGGQLDVPDDVIGEGYRADLDMKTTLRERTVSVEQALRAIWEEDHIGRNARERGPWRIK